MLNWILCKDKMPIEDEQGLSKQVLLTVEYKPKYKSSCKREVIVSQTFEGEWIGFLTENEVESVDCIAWSEFPEPYKENRMNTKEARDFFENLRVAEIQRELNKEHSCNCEDKIKHLSKKVIKLQRKNRNLEGMVKQYKELLYQTTKLLKDEG